MVNAKFTFPANRIARESVKNPLELGICVRGAVIENASSKRARQRSRARLQQAAQKPRLRMMAAVESLPAYEVEVAPPPLDVGETDAIAVPPLGEISRPETTLAGPAEVIALQRRLLRVPQDVSDEDAPFDPPDADDMFGFSDLAEEEAPFDAPDLDDNDVFCGAVVPDPVVEACEPQTEPMLAPALSVDQTLPLVLDALEEKPAELLLTPEEEEPAELLLTSEEGAPAELLLVPANENAPAPVQAPPSPEPPRPLAAVPRPNPIGCEQAVPPISIHASWDRAEIGALLDALAADRRMSRAEISTSRGGIDAAAAHLDKYESPDLLIVDSDLTAKEILDGCNRIGRLLKPTTKVIVVGAVNDIALLRDLTSRGVKYVVPPIRQDDLIRCVCAMYAEADKSHVIAVIGARGGVGASTIAHNIAWSIAERQDAATALVDLDLSFGTAAFDFKLDTPHSIADVLFAEDQAQVNVDNVIATRGDRLQILTAPAKVERAFDLEGPALEALIGGVRRTSAYVVLDLPHAWEPAVKQALVMADDVVIVSSPDLAGLRNADNMMKWCRAARANRNAPNIALSMVGVPKRPEITLKDFVEALDTTPLASFAYEPALFAAAALKGQMIGETEPQSKAARQIDALATALTGREPIARKKPASAPKLLAPAVTKNKGAESVEPNIVTSEPAREGAPTVVDVAGDIAPMANNEKETTPAVIVPDSKAPRPFTFRAFTPEPEALSAEEELHAFLTQEPSPTPPANDDAPQPANDSAPPAPPTDLPMLELIEPAEHDYIRLAREAAYAELDAIDQPARKRSNLSLRLLAVAAGLFAPILLGAWYFETQTPPASAAGPSAAAAATLPPAPRPPTPAELASQYQSARALLVEGRTNDGVALLRRTADAGFAPAQYRLAKLYETGEGVEGDLAIARRWTERAATAGNIRAMHDLGVYFARGEGGPIDETAAFRWFRQAAEFGVADSQYNLGSLYAQGRGVAANAQEAMFWFNVAANQGDAAAAARVSEFADGASLLDIEQARARALDFAPRTPDANANEAPPATPATEPTLEAPAATSQ